MIDRRPPTEYEDYDPKRDQAHNPEERHIARNATIAGTAATAAVLAGVILASGLGGSGTLPSSSQENTGAPKNPVIQPIEAAMPEQTLSPEAILEQQANEVYDGTIELDNPTFTVINPGSEDNQRTVGVNDIQELGGQSLASDMHTTIEVTDPLIHADGSRIQIILPAMVDAQGRTVAIDWNPHNSDVIKVVQRGSGFKKIEKTVAGSDGTITAIKEDGTTETADQVTVQIIDDQPAIAP